MEVNIVSYWIYWHRCLVCYILGSHSLEKYYCCWSGEEKYNIKQNNVVSLICYEEKNKIYLSFDKSSAFDQTWNIKHLPVDDMSHGFPWETKCFYKAGGFQQNNYI